MGTFWSKHKTLILGGISFGLTAIAGIIDSKKADEAMKAEVKKEVAAAVKALLEGDLA